MMNIEQSIMSIIFSRYNIGIRMVCYQIFVIQVETGIYDSRKRLISDLTSESRFPTKTLSM